MKIGAIILAAGGSTRLGSPKQLLQYAGDALVSRAAHAALRAECRPVVVVLGSSAEAVRAVLARMEVETVTNPHWRLGMGTSIRLGLSALTGADAEIEAALLLVCDQPLVGADDLGRLIAAFEAAPAGKSMIAAKYNGTVGVPALFGRAHFGALLVLPDDGGAKRVLLAEPESVIEVPMPNGAMDIDTREQYEALRTVAAPGGSSGPAGEARHDPP